MNLVLVPNPILRKKCTAVDMTNAKELKTIKSKASTMLKIMYKNHGCGLAAPQVGIDKRFFVVDLEYKEDDSSTRNPIILINPEIVETFGEYLEAAEGCLSLPGVMIPVKRKEHVILNGYDVDGSLLTVEAYDFDARCFQHEHDHLEGITLFEKVDPLMRVSYLQEYEAALKAGAKPGVYE